MNKPTIFAYNQILYRIEWDVKLNIWKNIYAYKNRFMNEKFLPALPIPRFAAIVCLHWAD